MSEFLVAIAKTSSGTMLKVIFGVVTTKILAVVAGAQGVGLFSLLWQAQQAATSFGAFGGPPAVVQGVASRELSFRSPFLRSVFLLYIIGGSVTALTLVLTADPLTRIFLNNEIPASLIRWLALPVFLAVAVQFFGGLLNGYLALGRLALQQSIVAFVMAVLAYPAAILVGKGYGVALVALLTFSQLGALFFGVLATMKAGWLQPVIFGHGWLNRDHVRSFFSIAGTIMFTSVAVTGTLFVVRGMIVKKFGLSGAGIFDVAWTLSMTYMAFMLSSLGTYYMPKLSKTFESTEKKVLINKTLRFVVVLTIPTIGLVIVCKPILINLLYTNEFIPSLELIRWMLIGDFFKAICWVLAMPMISYGHMRPYFYLELFWNLVFFLSCLVSIYYFGDFQYIGLAFLLLYIVYCLLAYVYVKKYHGFSFDVKNIQSIVIGICILMLLSFITWDLTEFSMLPALVWLVFSLFFVFISTTVVERQNVFLFIKNKVRHV